MERRSSSSLRQWLKLEGQSYQAREAYMPDVIEDGFGRFDGAIVNTTGRGLLVGKSLATAPRN